MLGKKFCFIIALAPIMMYSMEKPKEYTVGMKIPNDTFSGKKINPIHMTITFLGAADADKIKVATGYLARLHQTRPIEVKVGAEDVFGTNENPVPVRRLEIINSDLKELFIEMHQKLGVCEPFQPKKLDIPNWHIAVRDSNLQKEFAAKVGNLLLGGKLFIKALGPSDPIVEFD